MTPTDTQYVTDDTGRRVGVLLGLDRYRELLDALEELKDLRAYDKATSSGDEAIPFEDVVREIERDRTAE